MIISSSMGGWCHWLDGFILTRKLSILLGVLQMIHHSFSLIEITIDINNIYDKTLKCIKLQNATILLIEVIITIMSIMVSI